MINFSRSGEKMQVKLHTGFKGDAGVWYIFDHNLDHAGSAEVMKRHFEDSFRKRIAEIRKEAYEEGYKTGKHKQRKLKKFCGFIRSEMIGWYS